jgi:hypothetical protein
MIIRLHKIDETASHLDFDVLFLCIKREPEELLSNEFIDDFITYDDGVYAQDDDPFLLSYIYAN